VSIASGQAALQVLATALPRVTDSVDPDRELLERFRQGDRSAFDALVRRHQKGVWRVVRRYVKRDADAADVTQQVFVRAFKALGGFRGAASVRSWLYRIAINCALSWIRDHRREEPSEIAEESLTQMPEAPGRIASDQDGVRLRAAVATLPPKQRMVLELRVFDDLSFKEVADLADCSENTAKVNFHYAVKRLRDILGADHER
jgi:RNA polymerase sigma-70 factor (ECF subfamily)